MSDLDDYLIYRKLDMLANKLEIIDARLEPLESIGARLTALEKNQIILEYRIKELEEWRTASNTKTV